MSEEYKQKQAELIAKHAAAADIIITTALIPGRPAPVLITEEVVSTMKSGSVIVDMAVEAGGNCPLSKKDEVWQKDGVTLVGVSNIPATLAADASALYAKNMLNFMGLMIDKETGSININREDDIIEGSILAMDGEFLKPDLLTRRASS